MEKLVKIFDALSDITRLRIYSLLLRETLCVCELVRIMDIQQSRISHGLKILKEANLIKGKRQGKWMVYSISEKSENYHFVQELKKEIKLPTSDLKHLNLCKKENFRETKR